MDSSGGKDVDIIKYVDADVLPPSEFFYDLPEGILPCVHLDHPDTGDDLVHDPHTLVRHSCRLKSGMKERKHELEREEEWGGGGGEEEGGKEGRKGERGEARREREITVLSQIFKR